MADQREGGTLLPRAVRAQRWRRSLLALLPIAGVVLTPMPAAHARGSHPFIRGQATATSQAIQLTPRAGGLAAAITLGTSIADYRDTLAQASSQAIDLGLIGDTLTVQCDAQPPAARPDQLPQPLVAESDHGNAHATKDTAGSGNGGFGAVIGHEAVSATTQPASTASYDGNALVIPKVLEVSGLHSGGDAKLIHGTARVATADARINRVSLLNNLVVLSGLDWSVQQRTGAGAKAVGHFTIGSATLAGHSLSVKPPDLSATTKQINQALTATGMHLAFPTRAVTGGKLVLSPLTIGIDQSPAGNQLVNPTVTLIQPIRNAITDTLIGVSCHIGSFLALIDLLQGAADGTGGLDLNLGGATATSDGKSYGDPFGHGAPKLGGHQPPPQPGTSGQSPGGAAVNQPASSDGSSGSTSTVRRTSGSPSAAGSESSALSTHCATTSPAGRPSCSSGAGLKAGLIALGVLLAFFLTDAVVIRLRRVPAAPPDASGG
jgi:hypothetical protein